MKRHIVTACGPDGIKQAYLPDGEGGKSIPLTPDLPIGATMSLEAAKDHAMDVEFGADPPWSQTVQVERFDLAASPVPLVCVLVQNGVASIWVKGAVDILFMDVDNLKDLDELSDREMRGALRTFNGHVALCVPAEETDRYLGITEP